MIYYVVGLLKDNDQDENEKDKKLLQKLEWEWRHSSGLESFLFVKPGHREIVTCDLKWLVPKNDLRNDGSSNGRKTRSALSSSSSSTKIVLSIDECNSANTFNHDEVQAYARTIYHWREESKTRQKKRSLEKSYDAAKKKTKISKDTNITSKRKTKKKTKKFSKLVTKTKKTEEEIRCRRDQNDNLSEKCCKLHDESPVENHSQTNFSNESDRKEINSLAQVNEVLSYYGKYENNTLVRQFIEGKMNDSIKL